MGSSHGQQTIQRVSILKSTVHDHGRRLNQSEFGPRGEVSFPPARQLSEYKGKGASAKKEQIKIPATVTHPWVNMIFSLDRSPGLLRWCWNEWKYFSAMNIRLTSGMKVNESLGMMTERALIKILQRILTLQVPVVISIKFLLIVSVCYSTYKSRELKKWLPKMNCLDV